MNEHKIEMAYKTKNKIPIPLLKKFTIVSAVFCCECGTVKTEKLIIKIGTDKITLDAICTSKYIIKEDAQYFQKGVFNRLFEYKNCDLKPYRSEVKKPLSVLK